MSAYRLHFTKTVGITKIFLTKFYLAEFIDFYKNLTLQKYAAIRYLLCNYLDSFDLRCKSDNYCITLQWEIFIIAKPFKFFVTSVNHICKLKACANLKFQFYGMHTNFVVVLCTAILWKW